MFSLGLPLIRSLEMTYGPPDPVPYVFFENHTQRLQSLGLNIWRASVLLIMGGFLRALWRLSLGHSLHRHTASCPLVTMSGNSRTRVLFGEEELRVTDQAAALWSPGETEPDPAPPPPVGQAVSELIITL